MNEYLKEVLVEMGRRVGANMEEIDTKSKDWFMEYEWTIKEQDDFKKWMVNYLYTNGKARRTLFALSGRSKKLIRKTVDMFVFQYGWKFKEEPINVA